LLGPILEANGLLVTEGRIRMGNGIVHRGDVFEL
jgi:hypothetical protein